MEAGPRIEINHGFIPKDLETLLSKIVTQEKYPHKIYISPYNRYGNSGSELYKIFFSDKEGGSVPRLLKTFKDKNKFKIEKEGIKLFEPYYTHIQGSKQFPSKLSGILLINHNKNPNKKPETFRDIMYKVDETKICKIIDKTFDELGNAYNSDITTENCNINTSYSWYLRGNKTKDIIEKLTVGSIMERKVKFNRQEIINPVYILNNLKKDIKITKTLIHGDFHQNNIVINDDNQPRVVDFAWSCKNDIYIDFSLLEMSIRFWQPIVQMDYKSQYNLERLFLHDNIENNINGYIDKYKCNQEVRRMIIIVREIRKWCKKYLKEKYDFKHHLLSQFLVLYGLQSLADKYNPFLVIPFLAKLGDKLIKSGYVNEV